MEWQDVCRLVDVELLNLEGNNLPEIEELFDVSYLLYICDEFYYIHFI